MRELLLIVPLLLITFTNFYLYKLTRDKYFETLDRLWKWESYIRRWLKDELKCRQPQD